MLRRELQRNQSEVQVGLSGMGARQVGARARGQGASSTMADQGASFGRKVRARALPRQTKARALVRIHRSAKEEDVFVWLLEKVGPTAAVYAGKKKGAQNGATRPSLSGVTTQHRRELMHLSGNGRRPMVSGWISSNSRQDTKARRELGSTWSADDRFRSETERVHCILNRATVNLLKKSPDDRGKCGTAWAGVG